ncbi:MULTISPECIES: TetR/AcrR family transcriptional regulator [Nocardioides]|uniref:TetR/AcrR family transcriptional regulator n=1 Tax=Nocardioides TaxID=1839 RepID=UPI002868297E|nr:helix-turn-helix domain-containing protein [Nocardioides sp. CGMCC 1.13656]
METEKRERARPLAPDERREALIAATRPLLYEHGRAVTTRLIAEAAGVAEGTIFRVFESKEELVDAAIERAFEPGDVIARIEEIDPDLPLRDRLVVLVSILQQRFRATFGLMQKVGLVGPPRHLHDSEQAAAWRARQELLLLAVLGADRDQLRVPADHFVHVLRLLTFSGSHDLISDGRLLTPEEIVDSLLLGLLRRD